MAKGLFKPLNPEKYLGDPNKIRFLSSWELRFMNFCDSNPSIIKWGSEELRIPYYHPIHKNVRQYYPDFIIRYQDKNGQLHTELIEIKPSKEATVPKTNKKGKINTYDAAALIINHAKWQAAGSWCASRKIKFRVLTESGSILIGPNGEQQHSPNGLFK